jgi:hypothetical protein
MNPSTAKTIRLYSNVVLPGPIKRAYPEMVTRLERWLKRQWRTMSVKERTSFRKVMERMENLPSELAKRARDFGFVTDWPPVPKETTKKKIKKNKSKSLRGKKK